MRVCRKIGETLGKVNGRIAMPVNGNTADMNGIMRLDPKAYRRTPWKNGGGVTIDIADAYAPGVTARKLERDAVAVRAHAGSSTPGPFSDLSGFDRILTVIGGRGLMLDVEGGAALDVREPLPAGAVSRRGPRSSAGSKPVRSRCSICWRIGDVRRSMSRS